MLRECVSETTQTCTQRQQSFCQNKKIKAFLEKSEEKPVLVTADSLSRHFQEFSMD